MGKFEFLVGCSRRRAAVEIFGRLGRGVGHERGNSKGIAGSDVEFLPFSPAYPPICQRVERMVRSSFNAEEFKASPFPASVPLSGEWRHVTTSIRFIESR